MGVWAVITFSYHVASRLAYVIGIGIALTQQVRCKALTRRHGVEAGFRRFRLFAAILMDNDIASFIVLCVVTRHTMGQALPPMSLVLAWTLVAIGCSTKFWATMRLGWAAFYWRDYFELRADDAPLPTGPYRILQNPMYTLGYVHLYGMALVVGSTPGLIAAAFDHISILVFHYVVEKPHFDLLTLEADERKRAL